MIGVSACTDDMLLSSLLLLFTAAKHCNDPTVRTLNIVRAAAADHNTTVSFCKSRVGPDMYFKSTRTSHTNSAQPAPLLTSCCVRHKMPNNQTAAEQTVAAAAARAPTPCSFVYNYTKLKYQKFNGSSRL